MLRLENYPVDARGAETVECKLPLLEKHLSRLAEIALKDMEDFFKKRPELERERFIVVLAQEGADHYLHQTGFKCLSVFTFFKKSSHCKNFHPLRHTRFDFGSDEFGHSSWLKHPGDIGFVGRGINCFGRSIEFKKDDTYQSAILTYIDEHPLKEHALVALWPSECFGEVIWDPNNRKRKV